jgi:hypothetical protein
MVVIRSPSSQLVPFKLHRFGQQRRSVTKCSTKNICSKALKGFVDQLKNHYEDNKYLKMNQNFQPHVLKHHSGFKNQGAIAP